MVAVKGGAHPAFGWPPCYDPTALSSGRIIIAAFNTGNDLPTGRTRVASVHGHIIGYQTLEYDVQLHVAAAANGKMIPATATCQADRPQYGR